MLGFLGLRVHFSPLSLGVPQELATHLYTALHSPRRRSCPGVASPGRMTFHQGPPTHTNTMPPGTAPTLMSLTRTDYVESTICSARRVSPHSEAACKIAPPLMGRSTDHAESHDKSSKLTCQVVRGDCVRHYTGSPHVSSAMRRSRAVPPCWVHIGLATFSEPLPPEEVLRVGVWTYIVFVFSDVPAPGVVRGRRQGTR